MGLVHRLFWAWRRGRGLRGKAWQVFYVLEALIVLQECVARTIRHVHVHFGNNAADIARNVVALGNAREPDGWSWSFTMHGPTEFADVQAFDLAGKASHANYVVCISEFARSQLMALTPPEVWERFHVVHCGVPLDQYDAARPPHDGPIRVLCVGRLVPEKGQALLVESVAALLAEGLALDVTLVGQGPTEASLTRLIDHHRLASSVRLVGAKSPEEVTQMYAVHDVFCLPSFAEGLPIVLMEAMAAGIPVLTTRITGIPELVEDRESGLLVSPGDRFALTAALRELACSTELRLALGRSGRAAVARGFDLAKVSSELADVHRARARAPHPAR